MIDMLEVAVKEKFLRAGCKLLYKVFDDVDETLDYIESYKAPKINVFEMKDGGKINLKTPTHRCFLSIYKKNI